MQDKGIRFHILRSPFSKLLIDNLLALHNFKGRSFEEYLKFLLTFPVECRNKNSSNIFYLIICYHKQQLISSVFLYIPNINFPQEMRFSFISNVFVLPEFQHRGIASKCIKICESLSKKHYCSGILLATSNKTLKEEFYSKLNFFTYKRDEWLLKKDIISKKNTIIPYKETLYVTPFDLATIQSLCAFPHCIIIDDTIEHVDCCEIEEDFINLIIKYPNQFLYVETTEIYFTPKIVWVILDNESHRYIISTENMITEINDLMLKIKSDLM